MRWSAYAVTIFSACLAAQGVNDSHGREWRQLTDTTGFTVTQAAAICPRDGVTPCAGALAGWTWATREQAIELFGYFEPAILTSPTASVGGQAIFFSASNFLGSFRPTFSFTTTYSSSTGASGWSASTDANGVSIAGSVGAGTTSVSISGSFGVGPVASATAGIPMGLFLWRATGLGTGAVFAYDDAGQVASPAGGVAVANVLANDWNNGVAATPANVRLTQESSTSAGVTLNVNTGAVSVANGTTATTHTLIYKICDIANAFQCDGAAVRVTVPPYVVNALNDAGSASPSTGGVAVANVLVNDTLGAAVANVSTVRLTQLSTSNVGVTLNVTNGAVTVLAGTATGTHSLLYQICETANPVNCDQATVTVTVAPYVVNAVDDAARLSTKTGGTMNVLPNDRLGSLPATTANVVLSQVTAPPAGVTFNLSTGAVVVAPKTSSGNYDFVYRICERASATNCDTATVRLDLSGK